MASLCSPAAAEAPPAGPVGTDTLCVVGFGEPAAEDYADQVRESAGPAPRLEPAERAAMATALVVFVGPRLNGEQRARLSQLLAAARQGKASFVGLVSSFQAHFPGPAAAQEREILNSLDAAPARVVVFRPGFLLSRRSVTQARLGRWAICYPLVPPWVRSCLVDGRE
ncbi:MAG: hypothetical protein NZ700_09025, partial [Gemmataceae bacterium]|nr:hypothetical protein [Gemmataceae bacterium]MDW8267378.1 hypothetical protein [Gemmataceae bacterium]